MTGPRSPMTAPSSTP